MNSPKSQTNRNFVASDQYKDNYDAIFYKKSLKDFCEKHELDYEEACKLRRKGLSHDDILKELEE